MMRKTGSDKVLIGTMETLNATLTVNSQGILLQNAAPNCFLGYLKQSDSLSDHVHINDRIILLSFLADVRENRIASPISIRMNGLDRTRFVSVIVHCLSTDQKAIKLFIEANSDEINDIDVSVVSPFARAAHEMRTPLNAILGFADLLDFVEDQSAADGKRHEYITMIKKAGNHLLGIVNKTLKDQNRQLDENGAGTCLVANVLNETLELTLPLHGHRKIALAGTEIPISCCLDTLSFRQICMNLISNAIKYSNDDGHIDIHVATRSDNYCEITIKDDGIGMDEQHIARLGLPFLRASDVVVCKIEGVGLGLAMVFDLVKRANGQISFESQKGKGTRVKLLLPIDPTRLVAPFSNSSTEPVNGDGSANNQYLLTPKTKIRNNGKSTKNTTNPSRKTA